MSKSKEAYLLWLDISQSGNDALYYRRNTTSKHCLKAPGFDKLIKKQLKRGF